VKQGLLASYRKTGDRWGMQAYNPLRQWGPGGPVCFPSGAPPQYQEMKTCALSL